MQDTLDFINDLDEALDEALLGTRWEAKVATLDDDTPLETRVELYQYLRKDGALPHEATFFLLAWAIEAIATERATELLEAQYAVRFEKLETKYHLEASAMEALESTPPEYRALNLEFAQATNALVVATYQTFGEHKMAALFQRRPDEFDTLYDAGYEFFFGEDEQGMSEIDLLNMEHCD